MTVPTTTDDLLAEIEADAKNAEQAAFEEWLTSGRPQGDATSAHAQWEESSELSEHLDEWARFRALIARVRELEKDAAAQRFILEQCKEILDEANHLYVELNAYMSGSASVDDILQVKAGHDAMQGDS